MRPTTPLRSALTANALFSSFAAALAIGAPEEVGQRLGVQAPLILEMIGIGLAAFAAFLLFHATRRRMTTWAALIASVADLAWVFGSMILLLAFPRLLSSDGQALVVAIAGIVLGFGAWQFWGAAHAHRIPGKGVYRHCLVVETEAPAGHMWHVVSDLGGIERYLPSLRHSTVLDGKTPGVGAVRACEDTSGKRWSEECTQFDPGRSFTVRFLSDAPDFPFPAKTMRGGWEIVPADPGSRVMVWWELTPRSRLLAPLLLPLLAFRVDRDFPKVIGRMAAAQGASGTKPPALSRGAFARLLPQIC